MPKISVVLPVFNGEEHLKEALLSIKNQTFADFEVICINDGSTDTTSEILEQFAGIDRRFRIFNNPHRGLVTTLNDALAHSTSPFIARMDADDVCHPNRFELQINRLHKNPQIDVLASCVSTNSQTLPGMTRYVGWSNNLISFEAMALQRFIESPIVHPSVMFRRNCLDHGAYRDGPFPEDYELWLRWFHAGLRFEKCPQKLVMWRDGPARLTRTDPRYDQDGFFEVKAKYLAKWLIEQRKTSIWVWGAGRLTRKRALKLDPLQIQIEAWVDVDPNKIGSQLSGKPVYPHEKILEINPFVVVYVTSLGARQAIRSFFEEHFWIEGKQYLFAG